MDILPPFWCLIFPPFHDSFPGQRLKPLRIRLSYEHLVRKAFAQHSDEPLE